MTEANTLEELRECYDILLKTARRCARDLKHAIDNIPEDNDFREMMIERLNNFNTIFSDTADYRLKLHNEIDKLQYQVNAFIKEHGDKHWVK